MVRIVFVLFIITLSTASASSSLVPCVIRIQSYKHSGEVVRVAFETQLRSEAECSTLAKMHLSNFSPSSVKSKKVSYIYGGTFRAKDQVASRERHKKTRSR